jgi:capsular exopolysaccharide synthesis family protein
MPMTYDLNLREYWRTIRRRKFIIIFTVVMMTLFSFLFSIMGRPTPIYKTSASVKVEKSGSVTGLYIQAVSWSTTSYMETQMAMIKSYLIMEMVAKRLGQIPPDLSSEDVRNAPRYLSAILALKENVETEQDGNSDIINITATSSDPKQAQRVANTVAQAYKEYHTLDLYKRIIESKKFIEDQVATTHQMLEDSENAVRDFRQAYRMVSLDSQSSGLITQVTALQTAYDRDLAIQSRITDIAVTLERAENRPLSSKNSFYFEEASAPYKSLNERLVQLMLERDILLINYTENFPQVIEIKKKIHEIITSMRAQLQAQQQSLSHSIGVTHKQLRAYDSQLKDLPTLGLELARLEREVAVNREIYTMLKKQHQQALIQNAEQIEEVQIVKPALEPSMPTNPPKTAPSTRLGFIIGIILGLVFAFLIETFDTSIGAVEDVEDFLGVRVLGIIPHIDFDELRQAFKEKSGMEIDDDRMWRISRMISHFAPKTTSAEGYRALRTNINFAKLEKDAKTIVFTSSSPQEGKTTISINLAITMAQAGNKVLLIDGDFRRPVISKIFGIPAQPGMTDVILGNFEWREVVRSITDIMTGKMTMDEIMLTPGLDNLSIMTCGTIAPNPSELVSTKAVSDFLEAASAEYDFVIIDAPPVLAATDAAIWGTRADGTIIVYQVGKVARGALKRAKAQLDNVKANIVGVVLNGLKAELSPDYEYHDKYYYYYGSERKKHLSMSERIASLSESLRKSVQDLPGKVSQLKKVQFTSRINLKSAMKWVLLLIACALLGAGIYFSGLLKGVLPGEPSAPTQTSSAPAAAKPASDAAAPASPDVSKTPDAAPTSSSVDTAPKPIDIPVAQKSAVSTVPPAKPVDNAPAATGPRYAIQVRATQDERTATDLISLLKKQGHPVYAETADLKKRGVWRRIFIGPFPSENDARRYVDTHKLSGVYPDHMIRRVSTFPSPATEQTGQPLKTGPQKR